MKSALQTASFSKVSVIRVLLVEPGDIRHILLSIARRRRYCREHNSLIEVHFYLLESQLEILGRDLLHFQIVCDTTMPIRQKANAFLEVFGNCKLQKRTAHYVEQLGNELNMLLKSMSSSDGCSSMLLGEIIDLSLLRYRERDELENVFRNYSKSSQFNMVALLDQRHRFMISFT